MSLVVRRKIQSWRTSYQRKCKCFTYLPLTSGRSLHHVSAGPNGTYLDAIKHSNTFDNYTTENQQEDTVPSIPFNYVEYYLYV